MLNIGNLEIENKLIFKCLLRIFRFLKYLDYGGWSNKYLEL